MKITRTVEEYDEDGNVTRRTVETIEYADQVAAPYAPNCRPVPMLDGWGIVIDPGIGTSYTRPTTGDDLRFPALCILGSTCSAQA